MAKKKPTLTIDDWDDANFALFLLGELTRTIDAGNLHLESEVARLRQFAEAELAGAAAERAEVAAALERFSRAQLAEEKLRSKELTHGRVWLRWTRPALIVKSGWSVKKILAALRAARLEHAIRVKHELNREALAAYDDGALADLGLRRKTREEFGYEPFDPSVQTEGA